MTGHTLSFSLLSEAPDPVWCDSCALPSVNVWHVALEWDGRPSGLTTLRMCFDCGDRLPA